MMKRICSHLKNAGFFPQFSTSSHWSAQTFGCGYSSPRRVASHFPLPRRTSTHFTVCFSELRSAASLPERRETPPPRGAPRSGGWLHRRPAPEYVPESGRRPATQVPAWSSGGAHQERRGPRMQEQHVGQSESGETREESCVLREVLGNPCRPEETSAEPGGSPSLLLQGQ